MSWTITVLGFRGGRPDATSSCSGYLVADGTTSILVDCGPGIMGQLLSRGLEHRLDAVVLTHLHQDHCLDIVPLALSRLLAPDGLARVPLFIPEEAVDHLDLLDRWSKSRDDPAAQRPLTSAFDVRAMPRDGTTQQHIAGDVLLAAYPAEHPVPSAALRFQVDGATLAFSSDTSWCAGVLDAARDADLFVCEAAFLDPGPGALAAYGHLSPDLAGRLAVHAGARQLLLTHLSGQDDAACLAAARAAIREAAAATSAAGQSECTLARVGLELPLSSA